MDWASFIPPFFGVLAAFLLQWVAKKYEKRHDRTRFLKEIKKELETCSNSLGGRFAYLLPIDMWESGKASGDLGLIPFEVKIQLNTVYFSIKCHNYEAEKVRDLDIIAQTEEKEKGNYLFPVPEWTQAEKFTHQTAVELHESDNKLKKDIDDLLKQNIWS